MGYQIPEGPVTPDVKCSPQIPVDLSCYNQWLHQAAPRHNTLLNQGPWDAPIVCTPCFPGETPKKEEQAEKLGNQAPAPD